jgi:lipopolysaccharide export system protein LptA
MQADDMNLVYGADGRTLQRAELRRNAQLEIAGATAPRRLRARSIDLDVGADGNTLQQLAADEAVQLELPGEGDIANRRIAARTLRATTAPGQTGISEMTFTGSVEYREERPTRGSGPAVDRLARSDRLDTTVEPGFGQPKTAEFRGRVSIKDGATTAASGLARYVPGQDRMTFETPSGVAGGAPRVVDDRVSVSARWIETTLGTRALAAKGDVRSVLQPTRGRTAAANGDQAARKLPVMLEDSEPVNITADALEYDGARSRATYTGGARLWQGDTTIQSDVMVLDDVSGNLSATKNVRTRMLLEQQRAGEPSDGPAERVETLGSADQLVYEDAERRATYTGNAHVNGPQGDVTARRIVLFLEEDGRTLERAEAYDDVVARLEGGQRAEGGRLTYYGADERYVMSGTPVRIFETVESECRETTGTVLTFVRSTDTIAVVGTEGNRSRTTPGRCPERAATPPAPRSMRTATPRARSDAR